MLKKAVQRGRSERRGESYSLPYVELLGDARTKLADFFSILLETKLAEQERRLAELNAQLKGAANADELAKVQQQAAGLQASLASREAELARIRGQMAGMAGGDELATARQQAAGLQTALTSQEDELARMTTRMAGMVGANEAEQAKRRAAELERQLTDLQKQLTERDRELAALRGDLSVQMARLQEAQRGIGKALRKEVEKGTILVDLRQDHLLVNLASSFLFGSGEDQLKPAGVDALKAVGTILKEYPEYQVEVAGHADNVAIKGQLAKRFPTNQELSEGAPPAHSRP